MGYVERNILRNIPCLDGLRAVSILLVIIGHLANGYDAKTNSLLLVFGNAALGVNIFFVISGFLITSLLLDEHKVSKTINLRKFYLRRAFRILPPYYFYIFIIILAGVFGFLSLPPNSIISPSLFLSNYWPIKDAWYFAHFWSLAVEEQFYLIWPLVLLYSLKYSTHKKIPIYIAILVILLSPLVRLISHLYMPEPFNSQLYYMFHTRADSLMFGILCALGKGTVSFEKIYMRIHWLKWVAIVFILIVSPLLTLRYGGAYVYLIGYTLEAFCISLAMMWLIRNPNTFIGKVLNSKPLVHIGVLSYSLYIWQTLFLDKSNISIIGMFPFSIMAIYLCACMSYYLIEMPALKLRNKIRIA